MGSSKIKVVEVGPRDGLQNEKEIFSQEKRWQLIQRLTTSGLKHIEVGAFVSPQWVPQMEGSEKLIKKIIQFQKAKKLPQSVNYTALVPNLKGMERALPTGIKEVAIFGACSETFSEKNINCSIDESFQRFEQVLAIANQHKIKVRGYLSTAFGCPYEGEVKAKKVVSLIKKMIKMGVYEVSIGDTIGVGTPKQVKQLLGLLKKQVKLKKVAMHFHDTRGTALANVLASLQEGITTFDSSVGGLGGCPYAKGASGNLATEDLIYMLDGMGLKSGVNLTSLVSTHKWLQSQLSHILPSHVGKSGLPHPNIR